MRDLDLPRGLNCDANERTRALSWLFFCFCPRNEERSRAGERDGKNRRENIQRKAAWPRGLRELCEVVRAKITTTTTTHDAQRRRRRRRHRWLLTPIVRRFLCARIYGDFARTSRFSAAMLPLRLPRNMGERERNDDLPYCISACCPSTNGQQQLDRLTGPRAAARLKHLSRFSRSIPPASTPAGGTSAPSAVPRHEAHSFQPSFHPWIPRRHPAILLRHHRVLASRRPPPLPSLPF